MVCRRGSLVHDYGHLSRGGERVGPIPSPAVSAVSRLGLLYYAESGFGRLDGRSIERQVRRALVGLDGRPPFRLLPYRDYLLEYSVAHVCRYSAHQGGGGRDR